MNYWKLGYIRSDKMLHTPAIVIVSNALIRSISGENTMFGFGDFSP